VKILIDTHIFLWALSEPHKLSAIKRDQLESETNIILVSSVSMAEIMIKVSLGKLTLPFDPVVEVDRCGFELLDYSGVDALPLGALPWHHRDPFDRMLIAQSLSRGIPIMTEDPAFPRYGCKLV
jgi:PIN domain nuclease of toxin-antitoxin system